MAEWISDAQLEVWASRSRYPDSDDTHRLVAELGKLRRLVSDFTDPDPCDFDHHGGCQAHSYLDLKPGELCPHEEAKRYLAEVGADE